MNGGRLTGGSQPRPAQMDAVGLWGGDGGGLDPDPSLAAKVTTSVGTEGTRAREVTLGFVCIAPLPLPPGGHVTTAPISRTVVRESTINNDRALQKGSERGLGRGTPA